jgi:hypothetical protein
MNHDEGLNDNKIVHVGSSGIERRSNSLAVRTLQEASLKPDLGLRLLAEGTASSDDQIFPNLRLYELSILGSGQYSTTLFVFYDGELHALTIDFNQKQLDEILLKASSQIRDQIKAQLAFDSVTVRSFVLDGCVSFGVRAWLGIVQHADLERFVPLIAQEILFDPWEEPGAHVEILLLKGSRKEVEAGDISGALASLNKLLKPEVALRLKGRLSFGIDGYDDDPLELFEIPEVRYWIQQLCLQFPYWFYFMNLGPASTLKLIAFSLCKYEKVPGGKAIPLDELQKFLIFNFKAMNALSEELGESKEENDRRAREINQYFFP